MGSRLRILATGPHRAASAAARWAEARLAELEGRWSRFVPTSEVSHANASAGSPVAVSVDTLDLVERALEARELSRGRFDPTLLQALTATGYDRTFVAIRLPSPTIIRPAALGFGRIDVDRVAGTIEIAPGSAFDPGGIGKGLAADTVATQMVERGAAGALVSVGGDVRCVGEGPANGGWPIAVGDACAGVPNRIVNLRTGGVASSTCRRRRWKQTTTEGLRDAHHLIDPATGEPAAEAAALVSVVAANCADAEWIATALAVDGRLPSDRSWLGNASVLLTDATGQVSHHGDQLGEPS